MNNQSHQNNMNINGMTGNSSDSDDDNQYMEEYSGNREYEGF